MVAQGELAGAGHRPVTREARPSRLRRPRACTGEGSRWPGGIAFYERAHRDGVRPHLTTALLGERIGFVGVSGEFFCGHALDLRRRARLEHLFFLGYCNDYQQSFPSIEAASEGGYGTEPTVAPAELGAGERVMDRALIQLYQMRGRLVGG
jgi:hypothetical protein